MNQRNDFKTIILRYIAMCCFNPSRKSVYTRSQPSINRYFVENGVLQIMNVSHGDQGVYTCVARTPVDRDTALAELLVLGEPTSESHPCLDGAVDQ